MTIQQMMLGGRNKPQYISANSYFASGTVSSFDHQVPADVQPEDLLVFVGAYEHTTGLTWTANTNFTKKFDFSNFYSDTNGTTLWYKVADSNDVPGKKYTFSLAGGSRKTTSALIAFRNGAVGANGALYYSNNPGTRAFSVSGAALQFVPSISVVFAVNGQASSADWSVTSPDYITIVKDLNSTQPQSIIAYRDNVYENPVANANASYLNGGTGDVVEHFMFVVE